MTYRENKGSSVCRVCKWPSRYQVTSSPTDGEGRPEGKYYCHNCLKPGKFGECSRCQERTRDYYMVGKNGVFKREYLCFYCSEKMIKEFRLAKRK